MRVWVISLILFANIVIQSSVFPYIKIIGVKPDSLMTLVVSFALLAGNPTGAVVGFCGGMLQDLMFGQALGVHALQYMLIGYLVGLLYQKVFVGRILLPVFFAAVGNILKQLMMLVFIFFIRMDTSLDQIILKIILTETMYTAALMPIVYFFMSRLYKHKFMIKRWKFD